MSFAKFSRVAALIASIAATSGIGANVKEDAKARKIMHEYARCVVKSHHDAASAAILANADNWTIRNKHSSLISEECLGKIAGNVEMTFGNDLYRYALADALVNADFVKQNESDFSNRLPLAHLAPPDQAHFDQELALTKSRKKRAELEKGFQKRLVTSWLSQYGECVVRHDPVKARLWLLTPPDNPEEISRINDLRPAFNACLDKGTMTFNRVTMRGAIALNYYRLAMATPQPVAGKTQ